MITIPLTFTPELLSNLAEAIAKHLQGDLKKLYATTGATNDTSTFYTVKEAAKRLKRCEKTVLNLIKNGQLRAANVGSFDKPQYRLSIADLSAYYKSGCR